MVIVTSFSPPKFDISKLKTFKFAQNSKIQAELVIRLSHMKESEKKNKSFHSELEKQN